MKDHETSDSVLGIRVDCLSKAEVLRIIEEEIKKNETTTPFQVVTAYSEFFVVAKKDRDFFQVLHQANLVIPDGVGPLAAIDFQKSLQPSDGLGRKILRGLVTGRKILQGKVGETVSGVWLFQALIAEAAQKRWRVFLLGGFDHVAKELAEQSKRQFPALIIASDSGEILRPTGQGTDPRRAQEVLKVIEAFRPDVLFVAYGPVKQEKWLAANRKNLHAAVVLGVGGTFDEVSGRIAAPPEFLSHMGLKWLGRLLIEPRRARRIINAAVVFPWLVFQQSLRE